MKTSVLVPLSFALLAAGSPLGDRALFRKHHWTPHTRRYLLQSRLDSPAACAALPPANTTVLPDVSNSTTPLVNSTITDNSTDTSTLPTRRRAWKRIAQDDLPDVALTWQRLCLASGGDIFTLEPCVNYAGIDGINALLVDADPCAQQDNADAMITFSKSAGVTNRAALIANAIAYRKHPRNVVNILGVIPSTPYCQRAPKNPELTGIVNAQLDGVNPGLFGSPSIPIMPFGAPGTCPFGLTPDVATCTCVNGTDTSGATVSANSTSAATTSTNSTGAATADSNTATDSSTDSSTTDSGSTTATDSASANVTGTAASTTSAVSTAVASSTAAVSTTISVATPAATVAAPTATTTAKSAGPNFQPPNISGDVNDING